MCDSYTSENDRNVWNVVIKVGRIFMLSLHERGFISIRFHDFETASKSLRFGSVYTEPFSYSLRHAEVITDPRDLCTKKESTIFLFSAWRKYRLLHGKRARTGFSHELVKYLKWNE